MRRLVLATANAHKAAEMRAVLSGLGFVVEPRPEGLGNVDEVEETLEGNAVLKARVVAAAAGATAVADDTGLFVDALDGRPGVYSARYAGPEASDAQNVARVLAELEGVADARRGAHFRTVIAVAEPDGSARWVDGVLEGRIAPAPRGANGFGYDVVFVPFDLGGETLAELSAQEKNAISHRGRALRALAELLRA
ncbi:MAG TPA: RdgB/HAM1 family non-canonical purine NTP pyrophosphatase [Acidimicrobiales bacterium]|nr:MAG: non-canonical purine NTP pyrophosphatase, RdgB/HAM1 family [Actinobacteria bacterium 21-73-9]HQU26841.1 RdgB/HAM1 family non-canonical purine NTP pyrophosphatase [Acidimicrobiales bacterium]